MNPLKTSKMQLAGFTEQKGLVLAYDCVINVYKLDEAPSYFFNSVQGPPWSICSYSAVVQNIKQILAPIRF